MSLVFSAEQIKNMSKDKLLLPDIISAPNTGLIDQKAKYVASGANLLLTDESTEVFSDAWLQSIQSYHDELLELSGDQRTLYDENKTVLAAQANKSNDGHFPISPIWINLGPKLLDSNNGNPVTPTGNPTELDKSSVITALIDILKNGFTNGTPYNFNATLVGNTLTFVGELLNVNPGDLLYLLINGTDSVIVLVDTYTYVTDTELELSVLYGNLVDGTVVADTEILGFTDAQRSGQTSLGGYDDLYYFLRNSLLDAVQFWESSLEFQKSALESNPDLINQANIDSALAAVNTALSTINVWQALTDLVINGLLSDSGLSPLESSIATRATEIPLRITEIDTDLGSVAQAPDGSFSGSGAYYELFVVVDLRCGLGFGTLTMYYDNLRNQDVFDRAIDKAETQLAQYDSVMYVSKILADTIIGQDTFDVDTTTGLLVSDSILVMDNNSITYARTISQIVGNSVKLNSGIPVALSANALARIVKMK